jgi:hypothetical protein
MFQCTVGAVRGYVPCVVYSSMGSCACTIGTLHSAVQCVDNSASLYIVQSCALTSLPLRSIVSTNYHHPTALETAPASLKRVSQRTASPSSTTALQSPPISTHLHWSLCLHSGLQSQHLRPEASASIHRVQEHVPVPLYLSLSVKACTSDNHETLWQRHKQGGGNGQKPLL